MAGDGIKSAYERALEKLEAQGIERPRDEAYPPEVMTEMQEIRSRAEARVAETEILHQKKLATLRDPEARAQEQQNFRREVRRIEEERDRKLERLRRAQD